MEKELKQWEKSTQELADYFIKKYFGKDISDAWWVAEQIGGCLCANDYFLNLSDIVDFIRYEYTQKQMFEYYNQRIENKKRTFYNIKSWIKLKQKV